jgi:hypothetical protein
MNNWFTCLNLVLSVLMIPASFASDKECWNESRACTFAGTLELHTHPGGRTNKKGEDILETNLYLKLDPPITVHFKDWDNHDAPATELVTLMQIAGEFDHRLFKIAKNIKKNHATVNAKIFGQETGHHHSKFLIDANNNIIVDKK